MFKHLKDVLKHCAGMLKTFKLSKCLTVFKTFESAYASRTKPSRRKLRQSVGARGIHQQNTEAHGRWNLSAGRP